MNLLEVQGVTKAYASKVAVDNVSFVLGRGTVFGLLGPNGAGKTSLIRMITRITFPDAGTIFFEGETLSEKHQGKIGYMPEERGLYRKMKVSEQIIYLLRLKGIAQKQAAELCDYWLERFELGKWKNNKVQELSKGMQQKVQFIATIAHEPPLLILDEPFSGLDPINAQLIEDVIREFSQKAISVIFSTHRMEQVEEFCNRILLINDGRVLVDEDIRVLRNQFRKNIFTVELAEPISEDFQLPPEVTLLEKQNYLFKASLPPHLDSRYLLYHLAQKFSIVRFEQYTPSLREIFIEFVNSSKATNSN
ncbi:MAG: ATP-binding cassette domain-containing protein [Bacteroidia bacterium]|nr:ATP-binding cassette domain-containing protein [Bacteroidia bacterium]MDW8158924.1 ATP-binding cassette domain-containing protein [Bacteroidia bacterium]